MSNQEVKQAIEKLSKEVETNAPVKKKQRGLTTVEYAVAGSLIALAVVVAFSDLGNAVGDAINSITNVIN